MRTLIINLFLITFFVSCSSEIDTFDYDPQYLIEIDFKAGQVMEGGKVLQAADPETRDICLKAMRNETLPDGYKAETLCFGSGENNVRYHYLKITIKSIVGYYLVTNNNSVTLVHTVSYYQQNSCLKRWIISNI